MAQQLGTRLGPYEIQSAIGAGGMGEVYRARDTKLHRDIAIKVLPQHFALDPDRLARFQREAQLLASLNHPNIGAIYGLEDVDGVRALVLELVDGPTLADRIAQGPMPIDEALPIARQIAEALEAAHERGIIHRDLKPANVKLRPDGTVKVLDFGLAKALDPAPSAIDASRSPTITSPAMTGKGVVLGTAAYMSPEQAKGRQADKRSDVWAFGAVLYELLTGRRAFEGEDISDTIAAVLRGEPDWTRLPANAPAAIRRLLRRCLEKDRKRRLASAADAQLEIDEVLARPPVDAPLTVPAAQRRERLAWATAVAATAVAVGISLLLFTRPPPQPGTVIRFHVSTPAGTRLTYGPASPHQAISPDGRLMAYVVVDEQNRGVLALQSFEDLQPRVLPGTDFLRLEDSGGGAGLPFWSPDSRFIGFFAQGKLQKIDVNGGPPEVLCDAANGQGGTWNRDGIILFAPSAGSGLFRVPAAGGTPTPVAKLDSRGEEGYSWPWFLPDGRHFLYAAAGRKIYLGSLDSPDRVQLLASDSKALYSAGHLLFIRQRTLLAQPFDPRRLTITGEAFPVATDIAVNPNGVRAAFSASTAGVLTYRSTTTAVQARQLVWLDRDGKQVSVVSKPAVYLNPELAPGGERVAVEILDDPSAVADIWIVDARGARMHLTSDPADEFSPRWSPSGKQIAFWRDGTKPGLYLTSTSGTGAEELLLTLERPKRAVPVSWSPDGQVLLCELNELKNETRSRSLWTLGLGDRKWSPVIRGKDLRGASGRFSPTGRWIAYVSTENGPPEVFVVSFPDVHSKVPISTAGGTSPRWRRDGRELFYVALDNTLMAAEVNGEGTEFRVGTVRRVFERVLQLPRGNYVYDVTGNGQQFLVSEPLDTQEPRVITVVVNWLAGAKK